MTNYSKITAGLLAGATLVIAASPAEAQYRYYGHHYRGDRTALAIGVGALGLAIGAAAASGSRYNREYNGNGYYEDGYYGRPYAYNSYGYDSYYGRPYEYGYAPRRCWTDRVWDDYRGGWRRVRVCDRYR